MTKLTWSAPEMARWAAALVAVPTLVVGMAGRAAASSSAPPGNNGTIKIDGMPIDSGQDNDPHVACQFNIELFGYDVGAHTAQIVLDAHPPSGTGNIANDSFPFQAKSRAQGGATFDAAKPYDLANRLSGFTATNQGVHIKASVSVDGANPKHKVFWVNCGSQSQAVAPSASSSTSPSTSTAATKAPAVSSATATAAPSASNVLGETVIRAATATAAPAAATTAAAPAAAGSKPAAQVLGLQLSRPPAAVAGTSGSLPRTGAALGGLVVLAIAALGGGGLALKASRRRRLGS